MKKILITGIAGFIGSNLANTLINEGYEVVGIDNMNDYYDINLKKGRLENLLDSKIKNYNVNLENSTDVEKIFEIEKPEIVINLAAQAGVRYSIENPSVYIQSNIVGFHNIIDSSRRFGCKHFIYASSSSVYGSNEKLPFNTNDNVDHPISLYAATKKSNELIAHTYSHLFGLPTTGLRFFTVYGPWGRPDMALFKFTKSIIEEEPIDIFNNGDMLRDFTYIDDIVESIKRLIKVIPKGDNLWNPHSPKPNSSKSPYKIYNIGNNNPVHLEEFIDAIEAKLQIKAIKNYLPLQDGDVPKTFADVEDLFKTINFKPQTSIKDGIDSFIDWYLEYYKINL